MKILSVDTSVRKGSAAVVEDGRVISEHVYEAVSSHSEMLLSGIDRTLKKAGMMLNDIDAFAVCIGPGSFTGLRIGLSTVKGLAMARGRPIAGVSTLEALRMCHPGAIPCINAYRGEVYVLVDGMLPECSISPERLCDELLKDGRPYTFIGDGAIFYKELFKSRMGGRFDLIEDEKHLSLAGNAGIIAYERLKKGPGDDIASLVPNYIRRPDAELKR